MRVYVRDTKGRIESLRLSTCEYMLYECVSVCVCICVSHARTHNKDWVG